MGEVRNSKSGTPDLSYDLIVNLADTFGFICPGGCVKICFAYKTKKDQVFAFVRNRCLLISLLHGCRELQPLLMMKRFEVSLGFRIERGKLLSNPIHGVKIQRREQVELPAKNNPLSLYLCQDLPSHP